jgi:hypothetical protein
MVSGLVAGALCAFVLRWVFLAEPLLGYLQSSLSMPPWEFLVGILICLLAVLAAGWLASDPGNKQTVRHTVRTGASAGLVASTVAYIFSGSIIAGISGLQPVIRFGLTPTTEATYTRLIVESTSYTSTRLIESLWVFTVCGLLLGALGGLLAYATQRQGGGALTAPLPGRSMILPGAFLLIVAPLVIIVTVAVLALLPGTIQQAIIENQLSSFILPNALLYMPVGTQVGALAFGLGMVWPWLRRWLKLRPRTCFTTLLAFLAGIGVLVTGYVMFQSFKPMISLVTAGIVDSLGDVFLLFIGYSLYLVLSPVFGFLLGLWLVEKPPAPDPEFPPAAGWLDHAATALGMGLAGLFPLWILLSFAFTIVNGLIPFIPALSGDTSAATSVAEIIGFAVAFDSAAARASLAILTVIGLILIVVFSFFSLPEPQ